MNVEKLIAVKRQILKVPAQFVMRDYLASKDYLTMLDDEKPRKIPNCGTAACIAGWTVALEDAEGSPKKMGINFTRNFIHRRATEILGLTNEQAERLFYPEHKALGSHQQWPEKFWLEYKAAKRLRDRARVAARRIDHFIKTNGAE